MPEEACLWHDLLNSSFFESYSQLCLFVVALILLDKPSMLKGFLPLVLLFGLFRPSSDIKQ